MKLLEGYVKNRTQAAALAAVLGAIYFIVRSFKIPVFPPLVFLEFASSIYATAVLVLPYPYVWLFSLFIGMTSTVPVTFIGDILGLSTFYFIGKVVGIRRAKYLGFLASPLNCAYILLIFVFGINMLPREIVTPVMVRSFIGGAPAPIVVPSFISLLERMGVIELREDLR